MANKWFIDTGAWFACFYKRDRHHSAWIIHKFLEKRLILLINKMIQKNRQKTQFFRLSLFSAVSGFDE